MKRLLLLACVLAVPAAAAFAAIGAPAPVPAVTSAVQNPTWGFAPYDGRFTFVRVWFDPALRRWGGGRRNNPPWYHDYPTSDRNLSAIVSEVTNLRTSTQQTNILRLDDPLIFRFPILYLSEPGYWTPTDAEVAALRAYLQKGGFMIFDDFGQEDWPNFAMQMKRVLPDLTPLPLDGTEPVWRTFFDIAPEDLHMQSYRGTAEFLGLFEENDRTKRQIAMIDFKNDIGEFMEYSGRGFYPVDITNEAYKLGVNFIIYAVTH
jgi:hypothetical protein